MQSLGGIVLCGGQSVRMGRPKAWLPVGDEFLVNRIVRIVGAATSRVAVVAAPGQDLPALPAAVRVVRDEAGGRGPMQGLAAGIEAMLGDVDAVYVSACDVPFLRAEFVARVGSRLTAAADSPEAPLAVVPRVRGQLHPLAAAYRTAVLPTIRRFLAANQLRVLSLFDVLPTRVIEERELIDVDPELESVRNVNTPDEYSEALRKLGTAPPN